MGETTRESEGGSYGLYRNLDGPLNTAVRWTFVAIPLVGCFFVMDVPFYLNWGILREQYYGLMLAMLLPCTFILVPMKKNQPRNRVPWYDKILALLGIVVGLYLAFFYGRIMFDLGSVTPDRVIIGTIALALILEATRRTATLLLAIFGLVFIILPHLARLIPDMFPLATLPFDQQVNYLFLDANGILSIIYGTIVTIILGFLLFGNLVFSVGGGAFITDMAVAAFGRYRGGPGKIAVLASSLFATISGVAISKRIFARRGGRRSSSPTTRWS